MGKFEIELQRRKDELHKETVDLAGIEPLGDNIVRIAGDELELGERAYITGTQVSDRRSAMHFSARDCWKSRSNLP